MSSPSTIQSFAYRRRSLTAIPFGVLAALCISSSLYYFSSKDSSAGFGLLLLAVPFALLTMVAWQQRLEVSPTGLRKVVIGGALFTPWAAVYGMEQVGSKRPIDRLLVKEPQRTIKFWYWFVMPFLLFFVIFSVFNGGDLDSEADADRDGSQFVPEYYAKSWRQSGLAAAIQQYAPQAFTTPARISQPQVA